MTRRNSLFVVIALICLAAGGWLMMRPVTQGPASDGWQTTQAEITAVEPLGDGTYAYSVTYTPTAADGHTAESITQHALGVPRPPVKGQTLKIRYRIQEPVIFEILDELQWRTGD
ncbi:MAG: hypothetical protein CSA70_03315 [Rhodobacterales bacterium]|nr:MAG: hypothetical protein CSA70_03315 [Rhodobacterales bacterium]